VQWVQGLESSVRAAQQALSVPVEEMPKRIGSLQEEIRQLKKKLAGGGGGVREPKAFADSVIESPDGLIVAEYPGAGSEQMLAAIDSIKKRRGSYAVMLGSADEAKVSFVAAVSDDLIKKGLRAGDWVREAAKVAGGGGGGRPQMAQAGGKDPSKLADALETARAVALKLVR
jgi:alanyl-tRNA synthetase